MTFELLPSLSDALRILSETTGTTWTREMFFKAVIDHSLPLWATTPNGCRPVIESMGKQYDADLPELGYRRHALLSRYAIRDLAMHRQTASKDVAFEPGDSEHMTWQAIKARRLALQQDCEQRPRPMTAEDWDEHQATFMGESDVIVLSQWVTVTDDTCHVPNETIQELQAITPARAAHSAHRTSMSTVHLIKRNCLDGPIEAAIQKAGSTAIGAVWSILRDMAFNEVAPFTGGVDGAALEYTNDENELTMLTREALRKRLSRSKKAE